MRRTLVLALPTLLACTTAPNPRAGAAGAPPSVDRAADSLALLRLHARQREAHLARRADWLVAEQMDSLLSVSRGRVSVSARERVRTGFQAYLESATFQAWDDVAPPRIRISPDGRMAWVVVQKRVHVTSPGPAGSPVAERTRYAWLSVYEKHEGEWRMVAIASTDRPDP